ncbi:HlyD family type I secretion periplasmic adaptor subunit [Chelativorans alearense]|uniref:HlyD family type I secretion periplasmic adaptor subunit n=1 Tax=Chelativorans alearense TaxID=2681495 RepID=UPI0013D29C5D|nr:HlyD family type I secretion periplasmic adaptor subunit [Chelativorans alearense]
MTDDLRDAAGDGPDQNRLVTKPFQKRGLQRPVLWLTAFTVVAFFVWAANAPLEEVTRGMGKVAPLSHGQIIQSLEGGIVRSIAVQEGEEVAAGQTLAVLDDTHFRAAFQDLKGQTITLRAALTRLHAEQAAAETVEFDAEIAQNKDVVEAERELFQARRRKLAEATASLRERLSLAESQLALVHPMAERGAVSAVDEIQLERTIADLKGELAEMENGYAQDISSEIAQKGAELSSLEQQLAQKRDTLEHTELKSPVRGIVKNLKVTTRGGVAAPGETIMEIVPLDDQLYVEAEIRPQDVAFLRPGLPATVKITAYDYTIYGALSGKLVFISADTIRDETRRDGEPYYRVRVLTDSAALKGPKGLLPIKPGMVAEVDIQTGSKTVLEYLLKPLLKGQEALGER